MPADAGGVQSASHADLAMASATAAQRVAQWVIADDRCASRPHHVLMGRRRQLAATPVPEQPTAESGRDVMVTVTGCSLPNLRGHVWQDRFAVGADARGGWLL